MEKKITKKEILAAVGAFAQDSKDNGVDNIFGEVSYDEVIEFAARSIEQLDAKADKAREKAAEKRIEGDMLKDSVKAVLVSDLRTADEILVGLNIEDATKGKIVARLTALVKEGYARKESVKLEKGRKVMAYAIAESPFESDVCEEDEEV